MWESTLRVACSDPLWWRATCNSFVQCSIVSNCFPSIESFIHSSLVSASQSIRLAIGRFDILATFRHGSTRTYLGISSRIYAYIVRNTDSLFYVRLSETLTLYIDGLSTRLRGMASPTRGTQRSTLGIGGRVTPECERPRRRRAHPSG